MNTLEKAKPPTGYGPVDGSEAKQDGLSTSQDTTQAPPLSTDCRRRYADLHEDLGYFYLDKAEAAIDSPIAEFNKWYSSFVDCVTYAELLRHGRDGRNVI